MAEGGAKGAEKEKSGQSPAFKGISTGTIRGGLLPALPSESKTPTVSRGRRRGPAEGGSEAQTVSRVRAAESEVKGHPGVWIVSLPEDKLGEGNSQEDFRADLFLSPSAVGDFEPLEQHRHFCPWVHNGTSGVAQRPPGWYLCLGALEEKIGSQESQPEGLEEAKVGENGTAKVWVLLKNRSLE